MKLEAIDISFKYGKGSRQILDYVNLSGGTRQKGGDHGTERIWKDNAL